MGRDRIIDRLRGIMILYIIFIIHGLCWTGFVSTRSILFSILLFEMPMIFYISGAAQKLSSRKPISLYIKSRLLRVILPFAIWCAVMMVALLLWGNIRIDWVHLLTGRSLDSIPFVWHTWFIYPYLIISILGYFLYKGFVKWKNYFIIIYSIVIATVVILLDQYRILSEANLIRSFLVYSVFYVFGFTYKEDISLYKKSIILLALILVYIFLIISHTYPYATQLNKFPPNFAFLCFGGIATMSLSILLGLKGLNESEYIHCTSLSCIGKILQFANVYGFELYLYQNLAIWVYVLLANRYWPDASIMIKYFLFIGIVSIVLGSMAYCAHTINDFIRKKI